MITRYEADSCRHAKKLANKIESEAVYERNMVNVQL